MFVAEGALLEAHGHRVLRHTSRNHRVAKMSRPALAKVTVWNGAAYRELRASIRKERRQVVTFHNPFPLVSPATYYPHKRKGCQ